MSPIAYIPIAYIGPLPSIRGELGQVSLSESELLTICGDSQKLLQAVKLDNRGLCPHTAARITQFAKFLIVRVFV